MLPTFTIFTFASVTPLIKIGTLLSNCYQSMFSYKHAFSEFQGFQPVSFWSECHTDHWHGRERCSCRWCSDRRLHSSDKQSDVKVDGYTDGFPVTLSLPSHWSLSPCSPSDWLSHDNICTPICQYGQRLQRRRCLRKTSCYGRKLVSKLWNPSNFSHCKF